MSEKPTPKPPDGTTPLEKFELYLSILTKIEAIIGGVGVLLIYLSPQQTRIIAQVSLTLAILAVLAVGVFVGTQQ
jgi:hypothetical protein